MPFICIAGRAANGWLFFDGGGGRRRGGWTLNGETNGSRRDDEWLFAGYWLKIGSSLLKAYLQNYITLRVIGTNFVWLKTIFSK